MDTRSCGGHLPDLVTTTMFDWKEIDDNLWASDPLGVFEDRMWNSDPQEMEELGAAILGEPPYPNPSDISVLSLVNTYLKSHSCEWGGEFEIREGELIYIPPGTPKADTPMEPLNSPETLEVDFMKGCSLYHDEDQGKNIFLPAKNLHKADE